MMGNWTRVPSYHSSTEALKVEGCIFCYFVVDANDMHSVNFLLPLPFPAAAGFKGNARVVLPGITACIDCTLDLYPPQVEGLYSVYSKFSCSYFV